MKYLSNVVTLRYDEKKCTGCGMCASVCPHGVFAMNSHRAIITDRDLCMECGACAMNCAFGAIEVESGVGCAAAVISSVFRKDKSIGCSCGDDKTRGCC